MAMPSSSRCGSPSITARSMNAPGSPSSALQIRYFWSACRGLGELPLLAGRETAAAAAAQPACLDCFADLLGRHGSRGHRPVPGSRRGRCTRRCWSGRSSRSWPVPSAFAAQKTDARPASGRRARAAGSGAGTGRVPAIQECWPTRTASSNVGDSLLGHLAEHHARCGRATA